MVGFIWTMQTLHYPLFDRVGRDAWSLLGLVDLWLLWQAVPRV
jgi:hypothetical protein